MTVETKVSKDIIQQRQQLRRDALVELYTWHFENNGNVAMVTAESTEKRLAFLFLQGRGFAEVKIAGGNMLQARINSAGIVYVEETLLAE